MMKTTLLVLALTLTAVSAQAQDMKTFASSAEVQAMVVGTDKTAAPEAKLIVSWPSLKRREAELASLKVAGVAAPHALVGAVRLGLALALAIMTRRRR